MTGCCFVVLTPENQIKGNIYILGSNIASFPCHLQSTLCMSHCSCPLVPAVDLKHTKSFMSGNYCEKLNDSKDVGSSSKIQSSKIEVYSFSSSTNMLVYYYLVYIYIYIYYPVGVSHTHLNWHRTT